MDQNPPEPKTNERLNIENTRANGIRELAELFAFNHVHKQRSQDQETDRDWRLLAAEQGTSEEDFIEILIAARGMEFDRALQELPAKLLDAMIDVVLIVPTMTGSVERHEADKNEVIRNMSNVIPFRRK